MKFYTLAGALALGLLACAFLVAPDLLQAAHHTAPALAVLMLPASRGEFALSRPRAIIGNGVRAETTDPKTLIASLQNAFNEFKSKNDEALKAKADDVVLTDQIGKINVSISNIDKALADQAAKIAAANISTPGDMLPTDPAYLAAFKAHMRKGDVQAAMSVGTAADGGYLAPVEWDRTVTNKLKQLSPIRANAQVITISGPGFSRVYNDGVIGSGWVGETAARPETTTPGLTTLSFVPGEIYANPAITQQALDDVAIDLEQWLSDEVDGEFAIQENTAFLSGTGTNKPFGILTYVTGAANAAKHPFGAILLTSAASATVVTADELLGLVYSLPSERNGNAKFYMNRTTLGEIRVLKDGNGNYLWQPTYTAGEPSTLAGYQVVETPGMPNTATGLVPILFGDMAATYLVVDRVGIRVLRDPYTNKPYVHFYTTKRVGGGVQNPEYMRAMKMA